MPDLIAIAYDDTTTALSAMDGATEHRVWGTSPAAARALRDADADAEHAHELAARPAAWAVGAQSLFSGIAPVALVGLGVLAVRAGDLEGPLAAVVALLPLAAFEAVGAVPTAVMQLFRSATAAHRLRSLTPAEGEAGADATPASSPSTSPRPYGMLSRQKTRYTLLRRAGGCHHHAHKTASAAGKSFAHNCRFILNFRAIPRIALSHESYARTYSKFRHYRPYRPREIHAGRPFDPDLRRPDRPRDERTGAG